MHPNCVEVTAYCLLLLQDGQEGLQLNVRAGSKREEQQTAPADKKAKTGFQQTIVDDDTQAVKVSLNDCLACSGCVTSAETVLLQHQSLKEFVAKCGDPDTIVVVSVSPQSRASLAGEGCSRQLHACSLQEKHSSGLQSQCAGFAASHTCCTTSRSVPM
jgi:hypothetical protein